MARELGEQLYRLAQHAAAPTPRLEAHEALGDTLFFLGEYAPAGRTSNRASPSPTRQHSRP